jgi:hypothetical protein
MPKKTKPPEEQRDDNFGARADAPPFPWEVDAERERAERRAQRELMTEQTLTLRAQRFEAFASAGASLKTLGGFPAIELISNAALNELTVLARELHDARIAKAQS